MEYLRADPPQAALGGSCGVWPTGGCTVSGRHGCGTFSLWRACRKSRCWNLPQTICDGAGKRYPAAGFGGPLHRRGGPPCGRRRKRICRLPENRAAQNSLMPGDFAVSPLSRTLCAAFRSIALPYWKGGAEIGAFLQGEAFCAWKSGGWTAYALLW